MVENKLEETKIEENVTETFVPQTFIQRLVRRFQGRVVNVEFFCGSCCKKAVGGRLTLIGKDFIELTQVDDLDIKVMLFTDEKTFTEEVDVIIIPIENVCSVEISDDPCGCRNEECEDFD